VPFFQLHSSAKTENGASACSGRPDGVEQGKCRMEERGFAGKISGQGKWFLCASFAYIRTPLDPE